MSTITDSISREPKLTVQEQNRSQGIWKLLKRYSIQIFLLIVFTVATTGLGLLLPRFVGQIIDDYQIRGTFTPTTTVGWLLVLVTGVFVFGLIEQFLSAWLSERVARDLRHDIFAKLAQQSTTYITESTPAKLLTIATSDVTQIKTSFPGSLLAAFTAIITIIGSGFLLISLNIRLGFIALSTVPFMVAAFALIFTRISKYFRLRQENTDQSNSIIEENIAAAGLIRILNSASSEIKKYTKVLAEARRINIITVTMFGGLLIPVVNTLTNISLLLVVWFGGNQVISGDLSIGEFSAFYTYLGLILGPIFILGFVSTDIARGGVSLDRIQEVLRSPVEKPSGTVSKTLEGKIEFRDVDLTLDGRQVLKNISFTLQPGTKVAIVGPTASGKTQIFNLISGLIKPDHGDVLIDGHYLDEYDRESLYSQMGLVFQESIVFQTSLQENIEFRETISDSEMQKALNTSALTDLIEQLEDGLATDVSERGTNLSGGQKQRVMLARSLALNPKILLLDDFTARVDVVTEKEIITKLQNNYPDITLVSITQKIEPIRDYDQILVVMRGELIASGTHAELLTSSFEYQKIWDSQQSVE